jgi:hypothetical protein
MMKELQGLSVKRTMTAPSPFSSVAMPSVSIRAFLYEIAPEKQVRVLRKLVLQIYVLKCT